MSLGGGLDHRMETAQPTPGNDRLVHFDEALQGAVLSTWDRNIATGKATVNTRWAEMIGYRLDEIQDPAKFWEERIHPDDRERVLNSSRSYMEGVTPVYQAEYRLRHRDGRWIWILSHGRVIERTADGAPLRVTGIHQDITPRKEAEEALLLSREMYKNTVELTTQIPWVTNADGTTLDRDPAWTAYTGEDVRVPEGTGWLDAFHPEDRGKTIAAWMRALSSGEPFRVTHRLRRFDGVYRYCESRAQPQRNAAGEIVRWYGTTEDIHERVVAEQALRESEKRLALALEAAELATWDWEIRTGRVIHNGRWLEMLGFADEPANCMEFWRERIHPGDWPAVSSSWEAHCADHSKPYRLEFRVRHKSGEWRWILTHGKIVEEDEDGPLRASGINQDVTERRRSEIALAESERFSRSILESDQDCVALLDENGSIRYLNPAGLKRLQQSHVSGKGCWVELWREEDRNACLDATKAAFAGQQTSFQAMSTAAESSNAWWDVVFSPLPAGSDGEARVLAVARDITRLKEKEEEERAGIERERLRAVVESLNEGIVIAAPDRRILLMNSAAQRMWGLDTEKQKARRCEDLLEAVEALGPSGEPMRWDERPLTRAMKGEAFLHTEAVWRTKLTGRTWIANCSSTPVRSPSGELLRAVLTVRDVTEERQAAAEIRAANEVLHELSGQLLRLQDDERRAIARELHDGTVQVLSAVLMNLTMLGESPEIRQREKESRTVSRTQELTEQCVKELRTMSYLLHPPVLDELGLAPALRSWIDGFSERSGIAVDVDMQEDMERLPAPVETALFRITQEALGNVHRHAESPVARVRLEISAVRIELEITDYGKGIDPAISEEAGSHRRSGVGLLGMRERAAQLGGSLTIESRPGRTSILVSLPRVNPLA